MASPLTQINLPVPFAQATTQPQVSQPRSLLGPLAQAAGAAVGTAIGANNIVSGANASASALRQSGQAAMVIANYNAQLNELDLSRNLDVLSRQIGQVTSLQKLQAVNTSGNVSRSSLMVMNDTMSQLERQIVNTRSTAKYQQAQIRYQGQLQQVQAENQARAAEFRGKQQAFSSLSGAIKSVPTILGGIFNG